MNQEDLYIRFSEATPESFKLASHLKQYLSEEAARLGVSLSIDLETAGPHAPRLRLSAGPRSQDVLGWVLTWLQDRPSVTAFAESMDGSSSTKLSPVERRDAEKPERDVKKPRRLPDSDFRMEFKRFKF